MIVIDANVKPNKDWWQNNFRFLAMVLGGAMLCQVVLDGARWYWMMLGGARWSYVVLGGAGWC